MRNENTIKRTSNRDSGEILELCSEASGAVDKVHRVVENVVKYLQKKQSEGGAVGASSKDAKRIGNFQEVSQALDEASQKLENLRHALWAAQSQQQVSGIGLGMGGSSERSDTNGHNG